MSIVIAGAPGRGGQPERTCPSRALPGAHAHGTHQR